MGDGKTCVNSMAFNHNGNLMVTGSSDGCLRLFGEWNRRTFPCYEEDCRLCDTKDFHWECMLLEIQYCLHHPLDIYSQERGDKQQKYCYIVLRVASLISTDWFIGEIQKWNLRWWGNFHFALGKGLDKANSLLTKHRGRGLERGVPSICVVVVGKEGLGRT